MKTWSPANLTNHDFHTWEYTQRDKHFWPPENTVPDNAQLIIDLGANAGLSTGMLAFEWQEAFVVGVEMNPQTAQRARENLSEFGERVKIITTAVGYPEREEEAVFCTANAVDHLANYDWDEGERHIVNVMSLDNLLKEFDLQDKVIDFLKIDIEGAEWEVLNGGGNWPEKVRVMAVETHYLDFNIYKDKLVELGFKTMTNTYGMLCCIRPELML